MQSKLTLLAFVAAAALAGCDTQPETIEATPYDPQANAVANEGNVVLPPSIASTKKYRCGDNTIVSIDWLSDNKSANVRVGDATTPTQFTAAAEGGDLTAADGTTLAGTPAGSSVTYAGKSCKA